MSIVVARGALVRVVIAWLSPPAASQMMRPPLRDRPRNHSAEFRTFPEPRLPGPPLEPFELEASPR